MRLIIVFIVLLSCVASFANDTTEKEKIAKAIVYREPGFQEKVSGLAQSDSVKSAIKTTSSNYKHYFGATLAFVSPNIDEPRIKDLSDQFEIEFTIAMTNVVQIWLASTGDRFVNAYLENFSLNELSEILRRWPDFVNEKHQKFEVEIVPNLASIDKIIKLEASAKALELSSNIVQKLVAGNK